jgi:hypothetical protein
MPPTCAQAGVYQRFTASPYDPVRRASVAPSGVEATFGDEFEGRSDHVDQGQESREHEGDDALRRHLLRVLTLDRSAGACACDRF